MIQAHTIFFFFASGWTEMFIIFLCCNTFGSSQQMHWPAMPTGARLSLPVGGLAVRTSCQTAWLLGLKHNLIVRGFQEHQWKLQRESKNVTAQSPLFCIGIPEACGLCFFYKYLIYSEITEKLMKPSVPVVTSCVHGRESSYSQMIWKEPRIWNLDSSVLTPAWTVLADHCANAPSSIFDGCVGCPGMLSISSQKEVLKCISLYM